MEPWRLTQGDTSQTRRSLQRMRALTRNTSSADVIPAELEIAFIEMLHAQVSNSRNLRNAVARVDSLILLQDIGAVPPTRLAQQSVFGARAWEKVGDRQRALSMIGRFAVWNSEAMPYLGLQLREQGRIAAAAGDRKRARRAYHHYLGMRVDAEASVRPQVDSVRRELAKIEAPAR